MDTFTKYMRQLYHDLTNESDEIIPTKDVDDRKNKLKQMYMEKLSDTEKQIHDKFLEYLKSDKYINCVDTSDERIITHYAENVINSNSRGYSSYSLSSYCDNCIQNNFPDLYISKTIQDKLIYDKLLFAYNRHLLKSGYKTYVSHNKYIVVNGINGVINAGQQKNY